MKDIIVKNPEKINIKFRAEHLTGKGGMLLIGRLWERIGCAGIIDRCVNIKQREKGYKESEFIYNMIANIIEGGGCLDDMEELRQDIETQTLLGIERVPAANTTGEFLRKFTYGKTKQLEKAIKEIQGMVWKKKDVKKVTLDMDSSIYIQASKGKEGVNKAYNGKIGYHPLLGFTGDGELLHARLRKGSAYTSRGGVRFLVECLNKIPEGIEVENRADSGFYEEAYIDKCGRRGVKYLITAEQNKPLMEKVRAIPEEGWEDMKQREGAEVSQFHHKPPTWDKEHRYIVKREEKPQKGKQLLMGFDMFRYHVIVTNYEDSDIDYLMEHQLGRANVENMIKEHKSGFDLKTLPTGDFIANTAYFLIGQLAYNLVIWLKLFALPKKYLTSTIKRIRHRFLYLAGRIIRTGRKTWLNLQRSYRYQKDFLFAIGRLKLLCFI